MATSLVHPDEALTQFGVATITTKNTGEVEASYSLTVVSFAIMCFMAFVFVIQCSLYLDNGMFDLIFFLVFNVRYELY